MSATVGGNAVKHLSPHIGQYALITNGDNKILLLERQRSKTWCLPGGRLNEDEDWDVSLLREIKEEIGIDCRHPQPIAVNILKDGYQIKYCVYFTLDCPDVSAINTSNEHSDMGWLGLDEVKSLNMEDGKITKVIVDYLASEARKTGEVSFKPAAAEDTEFARNVHHRAYHDVFVRQFGEWDEAKQDEFFDSTWSEPGFEIISYEGKPCGYTKIEDLPGEIKAHEIVILPEFQGKGIGTALLQEAQNRAAERGVPVRLQVLRSNRAAELYARLGFKPVGENETHVMMEWRPE